MKEALIILIYFQVAKPLNVLIIHPIYAGSHVLTLQSLASSLLSRGESVTTIRYKDTHMLELPTHHNHTQMLRALNNVNGRFPYLTQEQRASFELPQELLWSEGLDVFAILNTLDAWKVMDGFCDDLLGDETLLKNLEEEKFDVAVVDLIYNECGLALAHKLSVPSVGYWAFSFSSGPQVFTTAPALPSFVPGFMSELTDVMNFWERNYNFVLKVLGILLMQYHDWYTSQLIQKYLQLPLRGSDLLSDLSGVLINTDYVLDYPRPMPPSFINIGGLQITKARRKLPAYMKSFLDGASEGAILFSMGFIFNPSIVPQERVDTFLSVFESLPQRVIFKYDVGLNYSTGIPENVLMVPFVPQQEVLAHFNTKLFITHCGMHGVLEAIYYGVPMVGMPVFIDQGDVLIRIKEKGIGKGIVKYANSQEIRSAIKDVISNTKYKENIDKLSSVMKHRRNSPTEDAIWLLSHVSETRGANHLKIRSSYLNTFQLYSLDCMAFNSIIIILLLILTYKFIKVKSDQSHQNESRIKFKLY